MRRPFGTRRPGHDPGLTGGLDLRRVGDLFRRGTRSSVGIEAARTGLHLAWKQSRGDREAWSFAAVDLPDEDLTRSKEACRRHRDALRKAGVPGGPAVCALSSPVVDILLLELPPSDSEPLDSQVVSHLQKQLGRSLDELVIDYAVLPESVRRPNEETAAVLAFSAPRKLVDGILFRMEWIGLDVARLITPGCALAPRATPPDEETRRLVIGTASEATSVSVTQAGHVLLEHLLPWGVLGLASRLASELDLDEKRCREILTSAGAPPAPVEGGQEGDRGAESAELALSLTSQLLGPSFRELAREAATSLDYCDSVLRHAPTSGVVLAGPLARHPALRKILETELNLPVQSLGPGGGTESPDGHPDAAAFETAACCALWTEAEAKAA